MSLKVNGEPIPDEAVQYELSRLVQFYSQHMSADTIKSQMEVLQKRARQQAVGAKLLMDQALAMDIPVPGDLIDKKIEQIIEQCGGQEQFVDTLAKQNLTEEMLRTSVERGCRVDLLIDKITEGLEDPTEQEMLEHFEANQHEYVKQEEALAQHILIKPDSDSEADRETARSKLQEIRKQIEDGSDFADLAAAHSECPSGKRSGGSLGWFAKGMMVPEFDEAVFSMEVGALSELVETEFGFHIIKLAGREKGGPAEFAEVSDKVRDFLRHAKRGQVISEHVSELAEKAVIEGM